MTGSSLGSCFSISTWGESHGKGVGVVVDGCPAGLSLGTEDIQAFLDRRRPGDTIYSTPRKEKDEAQILSGIFEGRTTGSPIAIFVENKTQRSGDYGDIATTYRPGHADYTFDAKYGFRDYRGGGRSSGRETIGRVAAGAIAAKLLESLGVQVHAYTKSIGPIASKAPFQLDAIQESPLRMPDLGASKKAEEYLQKQMEKGDSVGGVVECVVDGMPVGIGEPVFQKLDAMLGQAIFSIGAVKGVEIGEGFGVTALTGKENNDEFYLTPQGTVGKRTNHSGGILGGISDGGQIVLRAAFKPTPSISCPQQTVNRQGEEVEIVVKGRHDPIIVPRAVVVVESMVAITLVDSMFMSMTSRLDKIQQFFEK